MIKGKKIRLGERDLIVPPLNIDALDELQDKLGALNGAAPTDKSARDTIVIATHRALVRNYPDMTEADVRGLLDLRSIREIMPAVLGIADIGPEDEPGEAVTVAP